MTSTVMAAGAGAGAQTPTNAQATIHPMAWSREANLAALKCINSIILAISKFPHEKSWQRTQKNGCLLEGDIPMESPDNPRSPLKNACDAAEYENARINTCLLLLRKALGIKSETSEKELDIDLPEIQIRRKETSHIHLKFNILDIDPYYRLLFTQAQTSLVKMFDEQPEQKQENKSS